MQLIIDIKNESITDKIKTILNVFKDDGVKVQELKTSNQKRYYQMNILKSTGKRYLWV